MAGVTRADAEAQVRRTIGAYRDRVHEVRNDTDRLPPEGARIVDGYCSFDNDWQDLVQDAVREASFLGGMDDGLLLEYCAVGMELDGALGLDSWRIGRVERIVKDMDDQHRLSDFVNNSLKPKMEGFFDAQTIKTICSALETPMAEDKRIDIIKEAIASSYTELDMADIPDFFLSGKRINTEIKPEKEPWWAKMFQGTEIHNKIAEAYEKRHPVQTMRFNYYPIKSLLSILNISSAETNMLSEKERNMKPDIANLTLMHLYEIKPEGCEMQAKKEAEKYKEAMNKALAPKAYIALGPATDEGVKGQIITDKGKMVNYASPMDGVIIYQFQKNKNKQPLHLKVPAIGLNKENSFFTMEYWERQTGLSGMALVMFMLFLLALPPFGIPG